MTHQDLIARLEEERQRVEANLEAEFGTPNCTCSNGPVFDWGERRVTPPEGCPAHGHTSWEQPA